jgi:hypothetical protein
MMVSEAKQVLNDILKSTSELKKLLDFSAEQQQAVCFLDFVVICLDGTFVTSNNWNNLFFYFAGTPKDPYLCTSHIKDIN